MLKIILTKGLPGSGKSTWAKSMIDKYPGQYKRVNKDDLRALLDNSKWSKDNEKFVLEVRDMIIKQSLKAGKHIIVDDTNLAPIHEARMKQIANEVGQNVQVHIEDFTSVPVDECIKRDLKRLNSVGKDVIIQMYNQYLRPTATEYKQDESLPPIILCDLDGTLCLFGDKNPYDRDFENDIPNKAVVDLLQTYKWNEYDNTHIVFFSGRSSKFKEVTLMWLEKTLDLGRLSFSLYMREDGDNRKDSIVKKEMFTKYIESKYFVRFILDDRQQVVDMWRKELGLTCFQVNYGDF